MRTFKQETSVAGKRLKYTVERANFPADDNFEETVAFVMQHPEVESEAHALRVIAGGYQSFAVGELLQSPKGGPRAAINVVAKELGLINAQTGKPRANLSDEEWGKILKHKDVKEAVAKAQEQSANMVPGTGPKRGTGPTLDAQRKAVKRAQAGEMSLEELGEFLQIGS